MDMSPEDRESRGRLISQFWERYTTEVERARGLQAGHVNAFAQRLNQYVVDAGGDLAQASVDAGLVDELLGRAELRNYFVELVGEGDYELASYNAVSMSEYLSHERPLQRNGKLESNVAVVVAVGTIVDGSQPPGVIGGDSTAELLRRAQVDDSVKAVVLRVDSGGGSLFASEVIAQEIIALREAGKPVVASMGAVAASGGYWISIVADRVIANPSTITGSIGVFGMFPTYQRSLLALGVNTDGVGSTPLSGQLRPDREMSPEAKQLFPARHRRFLR